jgi:hypothetical protein
MSQALSSEDTSVTARTELRERRDGIDGIDGFPAPGISI